MNFKDYLVKRLSEVEAISTPFIEKVVIQPDVSVPEEEPEISKSEIMDYLVNNGIEMTQDNFELAKEILKQKDSAQRSLAISGESQNIIRYEYINHLNDLTEEQLSTLIQLENLMKKEHLENLMKEMEQKKKDQLYEYLIATVKDNWRGSTNLNSMTNVINKYAEKGYRVVSVFTNEVGVKESSITVGGFTSGTNATIDQVVILFERPKKN